MRTFEEVKNLEEENERLKKENQRIRFELSVVRDLLARTQKTLKSAIPNQVYTHKERRNTTVKFLDGSQQTVKLKKGEKDCIETAIAYCIMKQILPSKDVRKLVEEREEH